MGVKEGEVVLDVGCGTGRLASKVSEIVGPSGFVRGLDPSPHRIKIARDKWSDRANIEFIVGVGEELGPFSNASFDCVYYSSVFHWVKDKKKALAEAFRVLKPGGRIGITTPSPDGISKVLRAITLKIVSKPPYAEHIKGERTGSVLMTREKLGTLLAETGYTDLDVEIRERKIFHQSAEGLLEFYTASSFGNFLSFMPEQLREGLKQDMVKELEKERTSEGIELVSKTIFAIAKKPA